MSIMKQYRGLIILRWIRRGITAPRLRLTSGLILFVFVLGHFLNLGLGLISVSVMEAVEYYRWWVWHTWIGTILLYGAFGVHILAGLWKLVWRATWRMPLSEAAQIVLGLAIPYFLVDHILATRVMAGQFGYHDSFVNVLRGIWPGLAWSQSALIFIVWVHACIGINYSLRLWPLYTRAFPWLVAGAVLVPTLALMGWITAGRAVALMSFTDPQMTAEQRSIFARLQTLADVTVAIVLGLLVLSFAAVMLVRRARASLTVTYPGGRRLRARPGATLLEIARAYGEPHAAICGGRARCTTCRVQIVSGGADLPEPEGQEAVALARIGAPLGVRLACQIRPRDDLSVRPLVPVAEASGNLRAEDPYRWGVERRVTVMFTDLRGFTTLAERLYPYDAVFLLNRYFEVMSEVVRAHDGLVDKFLGDGIMALFGLDAGNGAGSRDALMAARDMADAIDTLNAEFAAALPAPLRMGVGVHMGPAVLGRVGASGASAATGMALTALGDTVNMASRLESMNKEHGSFLVVSDSALAASGLSLSGAVQSLEVPVRGRKGVLVVHIVQDFKEAVLAEVEADISAEAASASPG